MTFGAPHWLEALLLVPALLAFFIRNEVLRDDLLKKLVAARLLPNLAASASTPRRRWKYALALLGLTLGILALAQPRVGYNVVINHRLGLDLMLSVDTSKSMLSTDVLPDRLTRAKFAAQDLINSLEGDRVGLIAFAGTAFVEAPLTVDYSAVVNSVNALDTNTIPRGGTNIASAIREAADAFGKGEGKSRALVLFTDGEELEDDAVQAAKDVAGKFQIFTVGVGTREGSLIPVPVDGGGTEFVKDDQGQYVKSKLDEEKLKQIAAATGGFYIHLESGPATAKAIIDEGLKRLQEHEFETKENLPIERYQWPLGAGILLLIISMLIRERRQPARPARPAKRRVPQREAVKVAATVSLLLVVASVRGWSKNEGLDQYDQKDYKGAYDTFQNQLGRDPDSDGLEFDSGASAYKEGDYDKALENFGKVLGSKDPGLRGQAEYNLANTLVQRGALQREKDQKIKEWNDALNHYDQALKVDPQNPDAKYNRDLVKQMIDELNKKQPPQQQQDQQQQQQQKNQQNQQNPQQNQQQQNQQQQNQQQNQQQKNQQNQQQQNGQGQNQQHNQQNQQQNQQNQQQQNQGGQSQQNQQQQQNSQGQNQPQPQTGQQQQKQQQGGGQQQQNQQAQNQPQQGQGQQNQQNQQGQNQQNLQNQQGQQNQQDQQAQNQPQQGQQGGQQYPQQQPGQQGQDEQNQASANQNNSTNGASPSPSPGNGTPQQAQQGQQAEDKAAAQAATEAGRPGEMTPSQAKALIDSLRGEEQHVSFEDKYDDNQPVYKDW